MLNQLHHSGVSIETTLIKKEFICAFNVQENEFLSFFFLSLFAVLLNSKGFIMSRFLFVGMIAFLIQI